MQPNAHHEDHSPHQHHGQPVVKSALKKKDSILNQHIHIKWDEPTIQQQNKQRGGKMKIDEPKTPYHQKASFSQRSEQFGQQQALKQHLEEAAKNAEKNAQHKLDIGQLNKKLHEQITAGHDEDQRVEAVFKQAQLTPQQRKHQQFIKKRADHYSQFKKIKEAMQKKELEEDEN